MNFNNFNCLSINNLRETLANTPGVDGHLPLFFLNVQRVSGLGKFAGLIDYVRQLPTRPRVLAFVETWFTSGETGENSSSKNPINLYRIDSYVSEFCSRDKRSAGIAVYLDKEMAYEMLDKDSGVISYIHLKLNGAGNGEQDLFLTVIYMPDPRDFSELLRVLEKIFLMVQGKRHMLVGDFNTNMLSSGPNREAYINLLESYGYKVSNTYVTRPASGTLIDHCIVNYDDINNFTIQNDVSDHNGILTFTPLSTFSSHHGREKVSRSCINYTQLNDELNAVFSREELYCNLNSDDMFQFLIDTITEKITSCTTQRCYTRKRMEGQRIWRVDEQIVRMSNAKKKLLARKRRLPNNISIDQKIRDLSQRIEARRNQLAHEYCYSKFSAQVTSKVKWNALNELLGRSKSQNQIQKLCNRSGDLEITNPLEMAEEMNNYFVNVGNEMSATFSDQEIHPSSYHIAPPPNSMSLSPVTVEEVFRKLQSLQTGKSTGIDGISHSILKYCSHPISTALTHCINRIFETGKYPDILKRARVVPVHKGGNKSLLKNFRPISVLTGLDFITESCFNDQILSFLGSTNFFTSFQYGFRRCSNTTTASVELMDYIYGALDEGSTCVSGLFVDLKKAFDTVDHEMLLNSCEMAGIRGLPLELMRSYLSNRMQAVCINGVMSSFQTVTIGVPQGAVLGSTLFLIFFNDISYLRVQGRPSLFADDAAFFYTGKNDSETCRQMNQDLLVLSQYFRSKKLTMNLEKTKYINFHSHGKRLENLVQVQVDGHCVERVETFKYLGLTLDSHLNWKDHCDQLCKKIRSVVGILYKLKPILPQNALLQIYFAFVHSHLNYMVAIWAHAPACYLKPVQILQNRCLKIIFGLDRLTPSVLIYTDHAKGILPIKGLQLLFTNKFVRQVLKDEIHHTLSFPTRELTRTMRNTRPLYEATIRTEFGRKRILYYGTKSFNELNSSTKAKPTSNAFVKAMKAEFSSPSYILQFLNLQD